MAAVKHGNVFANLFIYQVFQHLPNLCSVIRSDSQVFCQVLIVGLIRCPSFVLLYKNGYCPCFWRCCHCGTVLTFLTGVAFAFHGIPSQKDHILNGDWWRMRPGQLSTGSIGAPRLSILVIYHSSFVCIDVKYSICHLLITGPSLAPQECMRLVLTLPEVRELTHMDAWGLNTESYCPYTLISICQVIKLLSIHAFCMLENDQTILWDPSSLLCLFLQIQAGLPTPDLAIHPPTSNNQPALYNFQWRMSCPQDMSNSHQHTLAP